MKRAIAELFYTLGSVWRHGAIFRIRWVCVNGIQATSLILRDLTMRHVHQGHGRRGGESNIHGSMKIGFQRKISPPRPI